jgi:hypothetical protein
MSNLQDKIVDEMILVFGDDVYNEVLQEIANAIRSLIAEEVEKLMDTPSSDWLTGWCQAISSVLALLKGD